MDDHDYDDVDSDEDTSSDSTFNDYDSDSDYEGTQERADYKPTTAPKLETMASVGVAIALWNHAAVAIPGIITNHDEWKNSLRKEIREWVFALPLPESLALPIKERFNHVRRNVRRWISYIFGAVYLRQEEKYNLYQLNDCIIWHPNETINSAETARNLLKSDKLTKVFKFRFACTYCLREEIEKLWPTMEETDFIGDVQRFEDPLIYYWKCYCANKLNEMEIPKNKSIDEYMIRRGFADNWPAIEYFFDRLNAKQQVKNTIWLIDSYEMSFQHLLLLKLNESQRLKVMRVLGPDILDNYALDFTDNFEENVIKTWNHVRNFIRKCQFSAFMKKLILRLSGDWLVMEIWNTARDSLKCGVLDDSSWFLKSLWNWLCVNKDKGLAFVSSVLLNCTDVRTRKAVRNTPFFTGFCDYFIRYNDVDTLSQLVNLYFPKATELAEFKRSLTSTPYFRQRCEMLIIDHQFQSLVKLLDFGFPKTDPDSAQPLREMLNECLKQLDALCLTKYSTGNSKNVDDLLAPLASSYPQIISNYKSELVMSEAGFKACIQYFGSTNDVFAEITRIANALPAEVAIEFKKKIIFSHEGIYKLWSMLVNGPLKDAEKFALEFLASSTDRNELRTRLIERLKKERSPVLPEMREKFSKFLF